MRTYLFDDRNAAWQTVEAAIGVQIYVLAVDDARGIANVLHSSLIA